ncbi:MAG: hypothetical protein LBS50_10245 [Prevotellaceae bacterium]|jgi:hypothetical protein|nr:hypothetical protein [Prevotellaceae bacterium]
MAVLLDLNKSQNVNDFASRMKGRLYIALLSDVDIDNFPQAVNETIQTNILKAGKVWRFLDCNTQGLNPNAQPGESPFNEKFVATPTIDGISRATLGWLRNIRGLESVVIYERCSDGQKFLAGSPCSDGVTVKFTNIGLNDGGKMGIALSLEGGECDRAFFFYDGEILTEQPVAVSGATFALQEKSAYIIENNASDVTLTNITGATINDVGRIIELRGAGTTHPTTIAPSATFILQNGVAWVATVGSSLFLQVVKTGVSTFAYYEVNRA